jgi:hypothetical protein
VNRTPLARDAAVAATTRILEEFFPGCSRAWRDVVAHRLSAIVEAAVAAALEIQRRTMTRPGDN